MCTQVTRLRENERQPREIAVADVYTALNEGRAQVYR